MSQTASVPEVSVKPIGEWTATQQQAASVILAALARIEAKQQRAADTNEKAA